MTPKDHNKLLGIFLMIHGGFQAFIFLLMSLIYGGIGLAILFGGNSHDKPAGVIFLVMVAVFVVITSVFSLPQILGGWKIFKEKPNAKTWGIIASIIACLFFPFGTAAGVYGLWFLFGEMGKQFYDNPVNPNYLAENQPVDEFNFNNQRERQPHSWK